MTTRLRDLRLDRGLSLRGLAAQANVAYRSVVLIEQGRWQPSAQSIRRLSLALDISPMDVTEFRFALQGVGR
jgi:transcriptional regulator with XRE-family HTH domain